MKFEKLGNIATIGSGQGAPQQEIDFSNDGNPFIRAGHLENLINGSDELTLPHVNNTIAKKYKLKLYQNGVIVFAKSGMSATKGRIYKLKNPCYVVNHLAVIDLKENISSDFIVYALRKFSPVRLINDSSYPSINQSAIVDFHIPCPPLYEQLHIAKILSRAENLISQRKESIRLLDEFLKSTFLEMFGDPVRNEKGWKLLQISDYGKSRLGKMLDGKQIIGNNLKRYLRNSNVQWFNFKLDALLEMDFDEKDKLEFSLRYGDILMSEGGEIGRCAIWKNQLYDCYFQKAIHRIRLNKEFSLPEFFVYMFWIYTSNGGLKKYMGAATISHLTGENLKKLKLPIPPIALQTQFAQIVEKTEILKTQYQSSLQELENLYGSLSQRAFSGELTLNKVVEDVLMAAEPEPKYHVNNSRYLIE